jgi:CubicO group peptidase (beta-lactamase class C family)
MNLRIVFALLVICAILAGCAPAAPAIAPTAVPAAPAAAVETEVPADPTAPVGAGAEPPAASASEQSAITQVDALLAGLTTQGKFSGSILVARGDEVLLARGYGYADREREIQNAPDTRFRLASITKQFTAVAILMLQEQGKLKVTDPVCVHIPDCPESWQAMTIHHLLTHKAGLYDFRDFAITGAARPTPSSASDVVAHVSAKPLAFAPGTDWAYSNGNYLVAGYIVEQVSGQPYKVFLHDHIFAPAGMVNTGYADYDSGLAVGYEDGYNLAPRHDVSLPYAAAGVFSTVEDLYRYLRVLEQATLLSQPSLDALLGAHDRVDSKGGFTPAYQVPVYYGYGWAIASYNGHPMLGHDGWIEGYSADMRYLPEDGLKILLLMNRNEPYAPTIGDQIVGMLLPGKAAVAAAAPATDAPTAAPASPTAVEYSTAEIPAKIDALMSKLIDQGLFVGDLLVAQNGEVIYHKTYGMANGANQTPFSNQTQVYLGDLSMQFTSAAIVLLEQDGKLSVKDSVCAHLANCPDKWKPITIHRLLTLTSGFQGNIDHCTSCQPVSSAEVRAAIEKLAVDPSKDARTVTFANYALAALIVEQVSGQPYGEFLQDRIFGPLGMSSSGFGSAGKQLAVGYLAKDSPVTAEFESTSRLGWDGIYSTAEDLLRWDQALYTDTPLTAASRERIFTPYTAMSYPIIPDAKVGYQWFLSRLNGHQYSFYDGYMSKSYGFYSSILRVTDAHITIISLTNQADVDVYEIQGQVAKILGVGF